MDEKSLTLKILNIKSKNIKSMNLKEPGSEPIPEEVLNCVYGSSSI